MKLIKIKTKPVYFKIDDEDFDRVNQHDWYLGGNNQQQIRCFVGQTVISLTTVILQSDIMVDHKDRDFLNNQKENLRPCNQSQNMANREKYPGKYSSKYKGVSFCDRDDCWRAHIKINGKSKALGTFMSAHNAAKAYNIAARRVYGEFAVLNKLESEG